MFFLDAAPTERLLTQVGSLITFLQEEAERGGETGGKLRSSILTGASSDPCIAGVRALALICDAVFWQLIRAVKPAADVHVLDVLPKVWPAAHAFFERAAASPTSVVDGILVLDIHGVQAAPVIRPGDCSATTRRSVRHHLDMVRIRGKSKDDPLVARLLAAAFEAMAKATANHAEEWLPAGLTKTDGKPSAGGKLRAELITDELRAKYAALLSTSTPVERLHAIGRHVDERHKRMRHDSRAGLQLGRFNNLGSRLAERASTDLDARMRAACKRARTARRDTLKMQLIAAGRAARAERDAQLSSKRAKRAAAAAELERLKGLDVATKFSQLTGMLNPDLADQLKYHKVIRLVKGFTVTQPNREAYIQQLHCLLTDQFGKCGDRAIANDLKPGMTGTERVGVKRKAAPAGRCGKKKKKKRLANDCGDDWDEDDEFEVILAGRKVSQGVAVDGHRKGTILYRCIWPGYSADASTWEPMENVGLPLIEEYEARLDAEAVLDAEEAADLAGDDDDDA